MYFKENLRYLRKKYHITQNDLAEKFGYKSFTTIQKWEDGHFDAEDERPAAAGGFLQSDD